VMADIYNHPSSGDYVDRRGGGGDDGGMEARIARLEADSEHIKGSLQTIVSRLDRMEGNQRADFRYMLGAGAAAVIIVIGVVAKGFGWI
jgi:hypothetical protein